MKFSGKSQGDCFVVKSAKRHDQSNRTEAKGTYRTHKERHLHNPVNLWIWNIDSEKSKTIILTKKLHKLITSKSSVSLFSSSLATICLITVDSIFGLGNGRYFRGIPFE